MSSVAPRQLTSGPSVVSHPSPWDFAHTGEGQRCQVAVVRVQLQPSPASSFHTVLNFLAPSRWP